MSDPIAPFENPETPAPQPFGASTAQESPFVKPLDEEMIIQNLMLDRPLKLVIPKFIDTVNYDYGFANGTVGDLGRWRAKGWMPVDNPKVRDMFAELHGGVDRTNKEFKPVMMARPKRISQMARQRSRSLYLQQQRDMHPRNKVLTTDPMYARVERNEDVTKYRRDGLGIPRNFETVAQDVHRAGPINPSREHMVWNQQEGRFVADESNPGGVTTGLSNSVMGKGSF